jgi:arylsulfatase A-like enzyme
MNSRIRLFFVKLLIICFLLFNSCDEVKKTIEPPPNVVFILADDLGYGDLGCYGQTKFQTPNIDKLAKQGLVFTQHYAGSTVCAPSRSAFLTGMHTGHTYIRGNKEIFPEGQHPLPDSVFTLAEMFKSRGYITGMYGKWGLGYPGSEGDPLNQGFDFFAGFNCQRRGHNYFPEHLWYNHEKRVILQNAGTNNKEYAPDLIQKSLLSFLKKVKDDPFFLYVPSIIPHAELVAPENKMKKYRGKFGAETPYEGTQPTDEYYKIGGYGPQPEPRAAFAAMVSLLDEQVGGILNTLKELNVYENTIIVFSSDNGPHLEGGADPDFFDSNGKLRGYKRDLYEGGIRVPLIVHWPKKIKPGTTDHISAFWDFLPTFSELTGSKPPQNIDGISMYPTLFDKPEQQKKHSSLYWEFYEDGGKQAVRKGKWKAVKLNVHDSTRDYIELYDLTVDISESNNLALTYPQIVQELDSIMSKAHNPSNVFQFEYEKKKNTSKKENEQDSN